MSLFNISRSWTPEHLAKTASRMNASCTPQDMAVRLQDALACTPGTHLVALLFTLDICMKQSPTLVGAIVSTLDKYLVAPLKFAHQQGPAEREWVVTTVQDLLRHWGEVNFAPGHLAARALATSSVTTQREGYFARSAQNKRQRTAEATATVCEKLKTPALPSDGRRCPVCNDTLEVYFSDEVNGWCYSDSVRTNDARGPVLHVLCDTSPPHTHQ